MLSNTHKIERTKVLARSLTGFIPAMVLIMAMLLYTHHKEIKEDQRVISLRQQDLMDLLEFSVIKDLEHVWSDLNYLQPLLQEELQRRGNHLGGLYTELQKNFLHFSQAKPIYDQVRILDDSGMELLRVNRQDGLPALVPEEQLQDKSARYYYERYMQLKPGELYASPFDLNIEQGKIELPEKPMIRFARAIHDPQGKVKGCVLLNYKGSALLKRLEQMYEGTTLLINEAGFYLYHPNKNKQWGFLYPDRKDHTLQIDAPDIWQQLSSSLEGQFFHDGSLIAYRTIDPAQNIKVNDHLTWRIVHLFSPQEFRALGHADKIPPWAEFIVLSIFFGIMSTLISLIITMKAHVISATSRSEEHYRLAQQLQESNDIKNLLLDILSHDLKNPAGAISSLAEILHDELGDNELVDLIQQSVMSLNKIIMNTSTLSKINMGEEIEFEELDLTKMVKEVVEELKPQLESCGMWLQMDLPASCHVQANPILSVAFKNYITNAMRYAPEGGWLHISIKPESNSVLVEFADQGETIPDDQRETIFERRKQLAEKSSEGSGLGLAIVKRIAMMHQSDVGVLPNKPKGNIFYIRLPR